jgi:hypothetical protein
VGFFNDAMTAPPGVALTLVPFGSVSVTSTSALQACFSADWAQHAAAGVSIKNANVNEVFIEISRVSNLKTAGLSPSTFYGPQTPRSRALVEACRYQVQNDAGNLITVTALNSRFKIDHSKPALA